MKIINLIYFKDKSKNGNFGDELSKFITYNLINKNRYDLVYNKDNIEINLVCIGSYIHMAKDNSYIFGSGIRTHDCNINKNLKVFAIRGPLSKKNLEDRNIYVPNVFGDPALLLSYFYKPVINKNLNLYIGVIPHKSNYNKYINKINTNKFILIDPTDKWENVINIICSCKSIISSSLHGLICSDAYNIPNIWLDEYKLPEGDFKFKDYFLSQKREYVKINSIDEYSDKKLYLKGNQINLTTLINSFPFSKL